MMIQIMATILALAEVDEDKATTCFELLDELCENEITVIAPHVRALINLCLAIINNKSLSDPLRVKAISFIGWLARTKKKALVKHKLVESIISKNSNYYYSIIRINSYIFVYPMFSFYITLNQHLFIDTLFALMSSRPDDDNEEVYFSGENEDNTPITCATQTLDTLALHLPPEKLIPHLV